MPETPVGMRVTERLPYFISGAGFPDYYIVGADMLEKGSVGVRAAGFFDSEWKFSEAECAFGR